MKKVLFIIPELSHGGTNKSLEFLIPHLTDLCDISIVSLNNNGIYKEIFRNYNLNTISNYFIKFKNSFIYRVLNHFFYPIAKIIVNCIFKYEANQINKKIKPDIVIAYQEGFATLLASKFKQNKISWIHCDYKLYNGVIKSKNEYCIYQQFNHIICVSKYTAQSFIKFYPQLSKRVGYMYNILNVEKIKELSLDNDIDNRFQIPKDSFICLSIGRYVDVKQFDKIPYIVSQIVSKKFKAQLVWYIIGDGDEKLIKQTKEEISKYGLENNIILLGAKSNPYPYIKSSNLLISLSKSEACPYVINEAKVLKVPVLSTDYPSAVELIDKGQGLIKNLSEFPKTIYNLIENKDGIYTKLKETSNKNNYTNDLTKITEIICS